MINLLKRYLPGVALTVIAFSVCAGPGIEAQIVELTERLELSPNEQQLYLRRALVYSDNNQPALALADIISAERTGDPVAAASAHGVLLYRNEQFEEAIPYFDRYLAAFPEHQLSLEYRARLLRDAGHYPAAVQDYERLFSLSDSINPGHYIAAAKMMAAIPDRGTEDALALLDARMAQVGTLSTLQRCAIELETQQEHYDAAITRFGTLDQRLKATAQWQLDVAELQLMAGRPEEAKQYLEVAEEQLETMRPTKVRAELQLRLEQLKTRG